MNFLDFLAYSTYYMYKQVVKKSKGAQTFFLVKCVLEMCHFFLKNHKKSTFFCFRNEFPTGIVRGRRKSGLYSDFGGYPLICCICT